MPNVYAFFPEEPSVKEEPPEVIEVKGARWGRYTGSWSVTCRGHQCKSAADSIQDAIDEMLNKAAKEYVSKDEIKTRFCTELRGSAPQHCINMFGYKLSGQGGIYVNGHSSTFWGVPAATNGCGSGGMIEEAIAKYSVGSGGFTGDINEPIKGYSFTPACDAHDQCYNNSAGKDGCDSTFRDSMTNICGSNLKCQRFSDLYSGLVGVYGEPAYNEAGLIQACRDYKKDAKENCSGVSSSGTRGT